MEPQSGRRWAATVRRVVSVIDLASHRFRVEAMFDSSEDLPVTGSYVRLEIAGGGEASAWVPSDAIVRRGQLSGVYVVTDDAVRLRWIRTGRRTDDAVEVLAGLARGTLVVRHPEPGLVDGAGGGWNERSRVAPQFGGRPMKTQIAGRLADAFLTSKLTPLLLAAALGLGVYTSATLPSEEEPQIIVPLADIYLPMPGAEPEEIENRALIPLENVLSGIDGVEYVYSHAQPGFGLVTVRYEVGRDLEDSLVRLYATLMKYADRMPSGLSFPLVKTVAIDDVPFFSVTLAGDRTTRLFGGSPRRFGRRSNRSRT